VVTYQAAFAVTIIALVVAAASLVGRFHRARGIERLQLRWVALATALIALLGIAHLTAFALGAYDLAPLAGGLSPPILSAAVGARLRD
jgi:lipopolysaccharide export LptBFGC system permease protein LptF